MTDDFEASMNLATELTRGLMAGWTPGTYGVGETMMLQGQMMLLVRPDGLLWPLWRALGNDALNRHESLLEHHGHSPGPISLLESVHGIKGSMADWCIVAAKATKAPPSEDAGQD